MSLIIMKFLSSVALGLLFLVWGESRAGGGDFDLEKMQTLQGRTYHGVQILGSDQHGLTFRHRDGIAKIDFHSLSENIRMMYEAAEDIPEPEAMDTGRPEVSSTPRETVEEGLVLTVYHRLTLHLPLVAWAGCDPRRNYNQWPSWWSRYHPAHQLTIPCYRERTVRDFLQFSGLSGRACRGLHPLYSAPGLFFPSYRVF